MNFAKTNSPLPLADVIFVALVPVLIFVPGRQPPGPAADDAVTAAFVDAPIDDQTAATQTAKTQTEAQSDKTRRVINHAINAALFQGVPVMQ